MSAIVRIDLSWVRELQNEFDLSKGQSRLISETDLYKLFDIAESALVKLEQTLDQAENIQGLCIYELDRPAHPGRTLGRIIDITHKMLSV